jgi:hypothetical protein
MLQLLFALQTLSLEIDAGTMICVNSSACTRLEIQTFVNDAVALVTGDDIIDIIEADPVEFTRKVIIYTAWVAGIIAGIMTVYFVLRLVHAYTKRASADIYARD